MNNEKFKGYIIGTIALLKELARKAKLEADDLKEEFEGDTQGVLMGYYSVIPLATIDIS